MSSLLFLYPIYQSAKCVVNSESGVSLYQHWITFWMSSFVIEQLPLPSFISYPTLALLCLPESTTFVRNNVVSKGIDLITEHTPTATAKVYAFFGKYIPQTPNGPAAWWQFWKPHTE